MDGVLCDFERHWARVQGVPFNQFQKMSVHDRWDPIRKHGSFWETIPWKGDGKMLWNYIKKHDVRILSAYSSADPNCMPGKRKWIQRNISVSSAKVHIGTRSQKQLYSKKNTILIDDYIRNVKEFNAKGGIGIRHKTSYSTISQLKKLGL
jgi:hypothetical protein